MKAPVDKVRSEMSARRASESYSVPESSLRDILMKLNKGKHVILAPEMSTFRMTFSGEKEDLVAYIKNLDSRLVFLQVFGR
jgi:hypothetical protein